MGKSAYPTATDLTQYLTAAGTPVPAGLDLASIAAAAVDEFERRAGRRMLREAADAVRRFDPPADRDGWLDLEADLCTLTSVEYQPAGAAPVALAEGSDFRTLSRNPGVAPEPLTEPIVALILARMWLAPLRMPEGGSIRVTGRWGYAVAIPDDAWWAMLVRAAGLAAPAATSARAWGATFEAAVRRWRRV